MLGAMSAGLAFGTAGTAAAHAIQYPVGAMTHTPHGVGVALLMPYVMEFNKTACLPELAQIAGALGVAGAETDETRLADRAIAGVADLFQAIGIPRTLEDLGLPKDKQGWTAEQALGAVRLIKNNPRAARSRGDGIDRSSRLYRRACRAPACVEGREGVWRGGGAPRH